MSKEEFARRLSASVQEQDKRYAFFLGAGCSVSSGIPAAGALVRDRWLPRLKSFCAPDCVDDRWIAEEIPDYDSQHPAGSYGAVIERLFLEAEDRQREIERLCEGRFPGFGYAVLAGLIALPSGHFNVALTTNFDDLLSDAMYLFAVARPLVIQHESLAPYIRPTRSRPLVVKLHGDQRLSPRNTADETKELQSQFEQRVPAILHDRGLIFLGYGGNDVGITAMLKSLPEEALPLGVHWVSRTEPVGTIREWLEERSAVWVQADDFDETMLLLRDAFKLSHPSSSALDEVFAQYRAKYEELSTRILESNDGAVSAQPLRRAVKNADSAAPPWWRVSLAATRARADGPDAVEKILTDGLEELGDVPELVQQYAMFLAEDRHEYDRAREQFARAISARPEDARSMRAYAVFLTRIGDVHAAEKVYERAMAADPKDVGNLRNYALMLGYNLGNADRAEALFEQALALAPEDAATLSAYAFFLAQERGRIDEAQELFDRAIDLDESGTSLQGYALFLAWLAKDLDGAEAAFKRAIDADPEDAATLGHYATFLSRVRRDFGAASELYERALRRNPRHAINLTNYAGFLYAKGDDRAEGMAQRARDACMPGVHLEMAIELAFYKAANGPVTQFEGAVADVRQLLAAGDRSAHWDFGINLDRAEALHDRDIQVLRTLAAAITQDDFS